MIGADSIYLTLRLEVMVTVLLARFGSELDEVRLAVLGISVLPFVAARTVNVQV